MGKFIDLTDQRFGRLTVIERAENASDGRAQWRCQCDCGNGTIVRGKDLRNMHTTSCGCLGIERRRESTTIHGKCGTRLRNIWGGMKDRCYNPQNARYCRYGARGITVCTEWLHDFQAFWDWAIANGYHDNLSIDRIDNDKGYSPDNCRWATSKQQNNNVSTNRRVTHNGKTMTLAQWCEAKKVPRSSVYDRLYRGWTVEEALGLVPRNK